MILTRLLLLNVVSMFRSLALLANCWREGIPLGLSRLWDEKEFIRCLCVCVCVSTVPQPSIQPASPLWSGVYAQLYRLPFCTPPLATLKVKANKKPSGPSYIFGVIAGLAGAYFTVFFKLGYGWDRFGKKHPSSLNRGLFIRQVSICKNPAVWGFIYLFILTS